MSHATISDNNNNNMILKNTNDMGMNSNVVNSSNNTIFKRKEEGCSDSSNSSTTNTAEVRNHNFSLRKQRKNKSKKRGDNKKQEKLWENFEPIPIDYAPYGPFSVLASIDKIPDQQQSTRYQEQFSGIHYFGSREEQQTEQHVPREQQTITTTTTQQQDQQRHPERPSSYDIQHPRSRISQREERQKFLVFIYTLYRYIDEASKANMASPSSSHAAAANDESQATKVKYMKTQVRQTVKECTNSYRLGVKGYKPLMNIIQQKLCSIEGIDIYWERANRHLNQFWSKRELKKKKKLKLSHGTKQNMDETTHNDTDDGGEGEGKSPNTNCNKSFSSYYVGV